MIKLLILPIFFLLTACMDIDYHEVNFQQLQDKAGGRYVLGWTEWTTFSCDVYLMRKDGYVSPECYEAVIKHEERHCREHNYHPKTQEGRRIPECE